MYFCKNRNLMQTSVIQTDPQIQSGAPVFYNTRVPIRSLFDHLATGETVKSYLEDFPSVSEEQVLAVLDIAGNLLLQTYQILHSENFIRREYSQAA
jgi:uncharacterized protein (DUF433 family)